MSHDSAPLQPAGAAWVRLRRLTAARVALGRCGGSLPTRELLDFRLSHARARDAVLAPFAHRELASRLAAMHPAIAIESAAPTREEYLIRPDLGRMLAPRSRDHIIEHVHEHGGGWDLVIVVSDGLSTLAADMQAEPLLRELLPGLAGWSIGPIFVARHARVALADEVGALTKARLALILLGERPGLGAADSLGAYFTYMPCIGRTDADRNCISNIREGGLPPAEAAQKLAHLLRESLARRISGVVLKDDTLTALPHVVQGS